MSGSERADFREWVVRREGVRVGCDRGEGAKKPLSLDPYFWRLGEKRGW